MLSTHKTLPFAVSLIAFSWLAACGASTSTTCTDPKNSAPKCQGQGLALQQPTSDAPVAVDIKPVVKANASGTPAASAMVDISGNTASRTAPTATVNPDGTLNGSGTVNAAGTNASGTNASGSAINAGGTTNADGTTDATTTVKTDDSTTGTTDGTGSSTDGSIAGPVKTGSSSQPRCDQRAAAAKTAQPDVTTCVQDASTAAANGQLIAK